ncbi:MAG TPA: response regulator [Puia sp.]|nr:response regulator [Puia sp.]
MNPKNKITKVLVVEDEGDIALLLELLLDSNKMIVDTARNLCDARECLEREQPELILLDNRLPDGLGIDFISFVKMQYPQIKIIMISGVDPAAEDAALVAEDVALAVGADRFLSKPFTKAQLNESISFVLN